MGFTLPFGLSVGRTNLAGSFTVTNSNNTPNQAESNTVTDIKLALSCGAFGTVANPCSTPDPGVFSINPTATGAAGTACAGQTFSVSAPDAAGIVTFTPSSAVVLAPPGGPALSSCTVNFTLNVLKMPTLDVGALDGIQTSANLRVTQTGNVSFVAATGSNSLVTYVNKGCPTPPTT